MSQAGLPRISSDSMNPVEYDIQKLTTHQTTRAPEDFPADDLLVEGHPSTDGVHYGSPGFAAVRFAHLATGKQGLVRSSKRSSAETGQKILPDTSSGSKTSSYAENISLRV